jgi:hypothetical protein
MDTWAAGLVLLHAGLGVLLTLAFLPWIISKVAARRVVARSLVRFAPVRSRSLAPVAIIRFAGLGLWLVASLSGTCLIVGAAGGGVSTDRRLFLHEAASFGVVVLAALWRWARQRGGTRDSRQEGRPTAAWSLVSRPPFLTWMVGLLLIVVPAALAALTLSSIGASSSVGAHSASDGKRVDQYEPEAYYRNLTATNARQAGNSLFPAAVSIVADADAGVRVSAYCGSTGCHPTAYRQWLGSSHQRAATNPYYRRTAVLFESQRGAVSRSTRAGHRAAVRWCDGCHSPASLAATDGHRLFGAGQEARTPDMVISTRKKEGVNCLTCHGTVRLTELSGNGRFEMRIPADYPFAEHPDARLRWLHALLLRLRPGPHRAAFMRPELHQSSEFCASCHRLSYNVAQNAYKFLRAADDYGTWQMGEASAESVHGFYPPGARQRCQDCHNVHGGGVRSRVARPAEPRDASTATLFRSSAAQPVPIPSPVTIDVLALRRLPRGEGGPEELIAPLERAAPLLRVGESVTVDVVVSNRGVGHAFPGGWGDLGATWLEFEVMDAAGHKILRGGGRGPHEDLLPGTHAYGMIALDRHGQRLEHGDLWNMVTPLYYRSILPGQPDTDRRTILAGESDVARFQFRVPDGGSAPLRLRARLWHRRLRPDFVRWVAASDAPGMGETKRLDGVSGRFPVPSASPLQRGSSAVDGGFSPRLVAEDRVTLPVAGGRVRGKPVPLLGDALNGRNRPSPIDPGPPRRFYDYGVALLLQGDLPRAQRAMRRVQAWAPLDVQGYLGLGRVYLTEGDLLAARAQFEQARRLAPNDPRPRAFLATTFRKMGQYEQALATLEPLARTYRRDRLLWFDIGMSHYLAGRYAAGARAFEAMLGIDPDDLSAHYNLMRCLRRLQRVPEARREETIYLYLREDDNAKAIALAYLRRNPLADREARTIHEHPLVAVAGRGE